MPSPQAVRIYDASELMLKTALPSDCRIFQANMPLQVMDQLARESAKLCTYLIYQDRVRMNSSGATPVHEINLEISLYGTLSDVDDMVKAINGLCLGSPVSASGWQFILLPAQAGRRDVWEPRIQVKREWLQFRGFAIEP